MEKNFENTVNKMFFEALRENEETLRQLEGSAKYINCGGGIAGKHFVATFRFADGKQKRMSVEWSDVENWEDVLRECITERRGDAVSGK